ncbi:MAG: sulfotransferase [Gammaproteobacteria bacterium]|nr:sulfotransferase [Gammaproteobacteria bacterium]
MARLFPEAVILHVRRDPLETCLSIFRQEFNKHWAFAHRLADIGHYYCYHENLIARWHRELPGRITTVQYEELAGNFETTARRLVETCGLEWEPACLEFQRFERPIATFSSVQAREPVVLAAGRARRYREHLAPLVEALECTGWRSPPNP